MRIIMFRYGIQTLFGIAYSENNSSSSELAEIKGFIDAITNHRVTLPNETPVFNILEAFHKEGFELTILDDMEGYLPINEWKKMEDLDWERVYYGFDDYFPLMEAMKKGTVVNDITDIPDPPFVQTRQDPLRIYYVDLRDKIIIIDNVIKEVLPAHYIGNIMEINGSLNIVKDRTVYLRIAFNELETCILAAKNKNVIRFNNGKFVETGMYQFD